VHHLNIIDGGALRLIDWEYAGLGEPLFDLASVCVYHRYSAPQRDALLAAYASGAAMSGSNFEAALWLFEYVRDLWTAVRALSEDS
jgi:thiamine kinase-like enzyme